MNPKPVTIDIEGAGKVSGLLTDVPKARAAWILAHGAGAGMGHPFMAAVAAGMAQRGIATLRYQFPYMEQGQKRPDVPRVAHAAVRSAVAAAERLLPGVALFAGGKSFGGRMTSQAQAADPLPRVRGLVFLGFPLHPAGKPGVERAEHLTSVGVPMLFVQGTRDELADLSLLRPVVERLGERATLVVAEAADHSLHVLKRSGRTDEQVMGEALDAAAAWMTGLAGEAKQVRPARGG